MLEVEAPVTGTVWKVEVKQGDSVATGATLVILESMKMEIPVEAPSAGRVAELRAAPGQAVEEGETLIVL